MFYIHHISCISPQNSFTDIDIEKTNAPIENKLMAKEPNYQGIPLGILRRMGKAVRMGVGAAMPLNKENPDGIIIGTSNGGMEDCIKFLNQIIEYEEGMLTPTNFVQSTTNAIAGQIGLMTANKGYNCTHVHRGLAFENAMIDVDMLLEENPKSTYLLGAVDEISSYNYNIDQLDGWFKKEKITGQDLYDLDSEGSIAGEGAAMFLVNKDPMNPIACIKSIRVFHTDDEKSIATALKKTVEENNTKGKIDLLLSGENGDKRFLKFYSACENVLGKETAVARFKHLYGEYPTVSGTAVWLASYILKHQSIPEHMFKYPSAINSIQNILIYNNYKGKQHSFILVSKC